jgi:hypothetical protein
VLNTRLKILLLNSVLIFNQHDILILCQSSRSGEEFGGDSYSYLSYILFLLLMFQHVYNTSVFVIEKLRDLWGGESDKKVTEITLSVRPSDH